MRRPTTALLLAALAQAPRVSAQDASTDVARRDLLADAERASAAGDHAAALAAATRAGQLRMTPSVRLLIAQEQRALGQRVASLDTARQCVREAAADAALRNRARILAVCEALVATLAPQVGRVVVRVPTPPVGVAVRVNDQALPQPLWDAPYPVEPGTVTIAATAPGHAPVRQTLAIGAGEQRTATVAFAAGAASASTPSASSAEHAHAGAPTERSGPGAGPWVTMGVGAAALGGALVFALLRAQALAARDAECDATGNGPCRDARAATGNDANYRTFTVATNVALGVGAVGLAAGVLWLVLAPRPRPAAAATARWTLTPTAGGLVIGLGGTL